MNKTKVIEVGQLAFFESFPLVILFDESAPAGLRDVCIIHQPQGELELTKGGKVKFDDQEYDIIEVGPLANNNLKELGHVSFYFQLEKDQALLPGAVLLSPSQVPEINVDSTIEFTS